MEDKNNSEHDELSNTSKNIPKEERTLLVRKESDISIDTVSGTTVKDMLLNEERSGTKSSSPLKNRRSMNVRTDSDSFIKSTVGTKTKPDKNLKILPGKNTSVVSKPLISTALRRKKTDVNMNKREKKVTSKLGKIGISKEEKFLGVMRSTGNAARGFSSNNGGTGSPIKVPVSVDSNSIKSNFLHDIKIENIVIGDMVAMKVAGQHFIPGQPSIGKVMSLPNSKGSVLVHYYSGSYDKPWSPMMSRESPYVRQVQAGLIIERFQLDENNIIPREVAMVINSKSKLIS